MSIELISGTIEVDTLDLVLIEIDSDLVEINNAPHVSIGSSAELDAHKADREPHLAAVSGYDAAAFFNAITV